MPLQAKPSIKCCIELFGVARLTAGRAVIDLTLPAGATLADTMSKLARACPALVGKALTNDGHLADGYTLNINGLTFARDLSATVAPGDSILLLSAESGG